MLSRAISFFPALREMGLLNMKGETVAFPNALAEENKLNICFRISQPLKKNS